MNSVKEYIYAANGVTVANAPIKSAVRLDIMLFILIMFNLSITSMSLLGVVQESNLRPLEPQSNALPD